MAKTIKIDLNGHKIISDPKLDCTIKNNNPEVKLVITDSSEDKSGAVINQYVDIKPYSGDTDGNGGITVWARLGEIEIEGGTFENTSNLESTIYVGTSKKNLDKYNAHPTVTIKDGKFYNHAEGEYQWKANWKPLNLNVINNMAYDDIKVEGGWFNGQDPDDGDDNMGGTFVANGYKSVETEDGGHEVVKSEE